MHGCVRPALSLAATFAIGGSASAAAGPMAATGGPAPATLAVLAAGGVLAAGIALGLLVTSWRRAAARRDRLLAALRASEAFDYQIALPAPVFSQDPELGGWFERLRERLADEAGHLDLVLESMIDAVFVTDADGIIVRANVAASRLLGWSIDALEGRSVESLVADQERRRFTLGRASQETREFVFVAESGAHVPIAVSGSRLLRGIGDEPPGCIFVGHDITERKRAERQLQYLAQHDALTGLPNRLEFQQLLHQGIERCRQSGNHLALFYFDLDRFKDVNDLFGHAAGDRTLEILGERLRETAPHGAVVGRLAGDEFALFVENLSPNEDRELLANTARSLLEELSRAFSVNDTEVYLSTSIGIALCGETVDNPVDLIRNADTAMYHAKQCGGATYMFYDPEMNAATAQRLTLNSKLRRAIELDEFVVLYQPKVELAGLRLVGSEALLRWRLPGHGDIPPSVFIPLAEQTGLIRQIGEWVLRRVCGDYHDWRAQIADPGLVSINLSLRQLQQASFLARFADVFREYGFDPSKLELEITETTLMSNAPRTLQVLGELRDLGIRLSIDDFGTGFSSLSALQHLPVETLKIDQSFVRDAASDPEDATLVRTIIELGRNLGLEVIAEGVETEAQLEFLRASGCHYGQGLLFGAPMSAAEMLERMVADAHGGAPTQPGSAG
jgi:diguanylate cyclase (GGDEF)-like protein/PAS domain S-box-containing protein